MNRTELNRGIYIQAKHLRKIYKINPEENVYIHWKDEKPVVLPQKAQGYDYINTVKLKSILQKTCWISA